MLAWPDHVLFVVLTVFGPVWGSTMGFRRLIRAPADRLPRVRQSVYRMAIGVQWTVTAAALGWWLMSDRPWGMIGLVPRPTGGLAGVAVGFAIVVVLVWRQRRQVLEDPEALADVRHKLHRLERMMPRSDSEMRVFYALSLTAGICEEVLYRGFLVWYLAHHFGLIQSVAIAAAIFGLGHAYQGVRGMITTGLVGAVFGAIYAISGSLIMPMVMHALMDAHSGSLGRAAFLRGDAEEAEEAARQAKEMAEEAGRRAALRAAEADGGGLPPEGAAGRTMPAADA